MPATAVAMGLMAFMPERTDLDDESSAAAVEYAAPDESPTADDSSAAR